MITSPQQGMHGADAAEYLALLGVATNAIAVPEEEPWEAAVVYCEFIDPASGAVCTLKEGHSDRVHRDVSDPMLVMSWCEVPDLLVVGGPVDDVDV